MNFKTHTPPRWADRILEYFCADHLLEEIHGDLNELYGIWLKKYGHKKANRLYAWHTIKFFRPFAIKKIEITNSFLHMNMFKHNLVVAMRNMVRNKAYSAINIIGLALGMTCFLFLMFWVRDEKGVDNFHKNGKQLYNIYEAITANGVVTGSSNTPIREIGDRKYIFSDMKESIPEIENINFYASGYELPWGHPETFQVGETIHKLEGSRASADFFKMFSYPVIAGNPATALNDFSSIAISRKMANLFFKSPEEAIGKSIRYEDRIDFNITAVFEDVPVNSTLKFDFLINWESHMKRLEWASHNLLTTVQLAKNADPVKVQKEINLFYQSRIDKMDPEKISLGLQPFNERYLVSNFVNGKPRGGRIEYVNIFTGVALFILIIACINFMSLATARSVKRAREVGIRKVVGSSRGLLIRQFIGEAILLTFFALLISFALLWIFLPSFNAFTGKHIIIPYQNYSFWMILGSLILITGIIAGSYPALFLSSLKPVRILKGTMRFSSNAIWFRKSLSVFQFSLSILLLIATLVVTRQTNFVQKTHLGYNRENLLYIQIEGELSNQSKYLAFKNEAIRMPGIAQVDRSTETPHSMDFVVDTYDGSAETNTGNDAIDWEGKLKGDHVGFVPASVGYDFVKIMGLKIVDGRDFSKDMATDSSNAYLINQEAVKEMNMKDPVGKWISAWDKKGQIIGILQDYHTNSLRDPILPLILDVKEYEYFGVIMVRTEAGKTREALASLEKVYKELNPNYPFTYQFVDQEYEKLYRNEQVISSLSELFSGVTIVIACLGLLGLAMFSAEQRIKEIGIRKVLGATISNILTLFSKDFLQLVGVSFVIASPIGWYLMSHWLQSYAYRINLAWWIFVLAGVVSMLVALITISFQAVKAAVLNPVKNLRSE